MNLELLMLLNFQEKVIQSSKPSMVLFSNDGCHLCTQLKPICLILAEEYSGLINFFNVDTLEEEKLTEIFSDDGVPTIYFFVNGDGTEIPYPADENSGYDEKTLRNFFNVFTSGKLKIV